MRANCQDCDFDKEYELQAKRDLRAQEHEHETGHEVDRTPESVELVTDGGVDASGKDGNGEQQQYDPEEVGPKMAELLNDDTRKFTTADTLAGTKLRISAEGEKDRAKALSDAFSAPARRMYDALQQGEKFECPECDEHFIEIEDWQDHHLEQHYGEDDE